MTRVKWLLLTVLLGCYLAPGQIDPCKPGGPKGTQAGANVREMTGTISQDGESFTRAQDNKSWTISNPDVAKAYQGHRVTLRARIEENNRIYVIKLKKSDERRRSDKMEKEP